MAMSSKTRALATLGVLSTATIGLLLYAYYGIHLKEAREDAQKTEAEKLFSFDASRIVALTVVAHDETTQLAPRQGGGWDVVSPVKAPADTLVVQELIERMLELRRKSVLEEKAQDLSKYGLLKPSVRVSARLSDGTEHAVRIGMDNAFDGSAYALVDGSTDVLQLEGGFRHALEKDTLALREKRVAPFEEAQVRGLDVKIGERHYVLRKEDAWKLLGPVADSADETVVNRLLATLRNLQAERFTTDLANPVEDQKHGLDTPKLEATISLEQGRSLTLVVGEAELDGEKRLFARRKDATFIAQVPGSILHDLDVSDFELRDKRVLHFDRDQVATLELVTDEGRVAVERVKGADGGIDDWKITSAPQAPAKKWKMSGALWALASLKADGFTSENATDLSTYGLDKPARTIRLLSADGRELAALSLGPTSGEKVFVKSAASPRIFEVAPSKLTDVPSSRADLEQGAGDASQAPTMTGAAPASP
jgi:hypothetical protein